MRAAMLMIALVLPLAAHAEVFKWVDENGKVHYGDAPPEGARATRKDFDKKPPATPEAAPAPNQPSAAERFRELQREREAGVVPATEQVATPVADTPCIRAWKAYYASERCFDDFRLVSGGLRPEAFEKCQDIPRPTEICPGMPVQDSAPTYVPPTPDAR